MVRVGVTGWWGGEEPRAEEWWRISFPFSFARPHWHGSFSRRVFDAPVLSHFALACTVEYACIVYVVVAGIVVVVTVEYMSI